MAGCRLGAFCVHRTTCTMSRHFMQSHVHRVHACLAVICHPHLWQNDQYLLRASAHTCARDLILRFIVQTLFKKSSYFIAEQSAFPGGKVLLGVEVGVGKAHSSNNRRIKGGKICTGTEPENDCFFRWSKRERKDGNGYKFIYLSLLRWGGFGC